MVGGSLLFAQFLFEVCVFEINSRVDLIPLRLLPASNLPFRYTSTIGWGGSPQIFDTLARIESLDSIPEVERTAAEWLERRKRK